MEDNQIQTNEQSNYEKIITIDIEKEMRKAYLDYSMAVIVGRALPDVRDGLKPVHRRILYSMYERGLTSAKAYRKCADTVGAVLGAYHPHGDASVYDALVRLAQDFSMRYPLVDGQGNFGSIDGDPPAAYRYTEARMSKITDYMLADIDKETVDFMPNYDDRMKEPTVLPSRFPNLLVNGSTGIAVGMATNIPPHNMREVIDGMCYMIDNPDAEVAQLMDYIHGPDFPTGGMIMGYSGIRAAYATGRGKVVLRGRAEVVSKDNGRQEIVITELPYQVNKAMLVANIADLVKEKRIEGITALKDQSNREGIKIIVEVRRDANAEIILNKLYTYTQLQINYGVIMLALSGGIPKVLSLKEILQQYIDFQRDVITRRTQFDLKKAAERAHILEGLLIALGSIDEVIEILKKSANISEGKEKLMARFGLDDVQANAIVTMQLGRLTGLERKKIEDEMAELRETIAKLTEILENESILLGIIKSEAMEIREKYGDERKTEILPVSGEMDIEDLIPVENDVVTLTHYGYIKRQPTAVYRSQRRGGRGISGMSQRDDDFVEQMFVCSSHDQVLFLTDKGRMYHKKCYEIPEGSRASRGMAIVNLLPLDEDEKVTSMLKVTKDDLEKFIVMVTEKGIIKRTPLKDFNTKRKGGLICISLDEGDRLAWVRITDGNSDLIVATRNGRAIRFNEQDARPLGRTARGVKAIELVDDDRVIGMARVREGALMVTITELGMGRRTDLSEFRTQTRGGKGVTNYAKIDEFGHVCDIKVVNEDEDLIMITSGGIMIRIDVNDISIQSRYAQGVRVMRVPEGEYIATIARTEKEKDDEEETDAQQENQPQENEE